MSGDGPCRKCGVETFSWFVPSDRWNQAVGRENNHLILCATCFVRMHEEETGMSCTWELDPATPFTRDGLPQWVLATSRADAPDLT